MWKIDCKENLFILTFMFYDAEDSYDVVICQAVLRHLDSAERFVKRMMEFAKPGAYIICIDSNREFECDGLYIDGMDYFRLCEHAGMERIGKQNWSNREEIMRLRFVTHI